MVGKKWSEIVMAGSPLSLSPHLILLVKDAISFYEALLPFVFAKHKKKTQYKHIYHCIHMHCINNSSKALSIYTNLDEE